MNRITPWSVKGVDDDAREMARKAAQAEGMTLGAWIDRAIRKSTGLPVESLDSGVSTTVGTTNFPASPIDRGEIVEVDYRTTSSDDTPSTDHVDVAGVATDAGSDVTAPDSRPTPPELQLDPEERFGAGVEVTNTPSRRRWRSLPGLFDVRGRMVHLSAAGLVIGAGLLIYWVAFTGPDDPGPAAAATQDNANRSIAPPLPATPDLAERDDTPPPSEPGVIEMLTAAADQGDAVAQHDLAVRFLDGKTVDADPDKARAWMERAATQGMARAQHRLAVMYADGKGVGEDANRAAMWHTRARRTDYGFGIFYRTPLSWYHRWLEKHWSQLDNPVLFLASDAILYVKRAFAKYKPVTARQLGARLPMAPYYPDHFLLSKAHQLVVANSSFSVSAAMLNENLRQAYRPELKEPLGDPPFRQFDPWNDVVLDQSAVAEDFPHMPYLRRPIGFTRFVEKITRSAEKRLERLGY